VTIRQVSTAVRLMNNTLRPKKVLSTPGSVAIFVVALCLVVAGVTETVFAIREHDIEVKDSAARERGNIERNAAEVSSTTNIRVPWAVSYFGSQAAPAVLEEMPARNMWVLFSPPSDAISNTTAVASSQRDMNASSPKVSGRPVSAPSSPLPVPIALASTEATVAQPMLSREAVLPTVIQVQCGSTQCREREVCCNASCGTCAMPGAVCSQQVCGMSAAVESASCGSNTCNVGELCCNRSCGICIRPGEECDTAKQCNNPIEYPFSATCGMATCNTGLVCCNPSCGTCAKFGEPCSQEACS